MTDACPLVSSRARQRRWLLASFALLFGCAIGFVVVIQAVYPPMDVCRPEYESPRTGLGFLIAASTVAVYLGCLAWLRPRAPLPSWAASVGTFLLIVLAAYVLLPTGRC